MISSNDFDHFLKTGYIERLEPGTSMDVLTKAFGDEAWIAKEVEVNGLVYGIIKVGFIEFHIYNERVNGISYRPDLLFPMSDFNGIEIPWIYEKRTISLVETELAKRHIAYKKYSVNGPMQNCEAAGLSFSLVEECELVLIDTEGGVTFLFEDHPTTGQLEACQICKYYPINQAI